MIYPDFESILKPKDEKYRKKKRYKIHRKDRHTCAIWMVCVEHFAYGDVPDPLKICRGKDRVEVYRTQ